MTACVLSKGEQNEAVMAEARAFLRENRPTVVALFKRGAGIGGGGAKEAEEVLDEVVECLTLLVGMTGFLEAEEHEGLGSGIGGRMYT
jgi:nuclear pore complex protein Nup205